MKEIKLIIDGKKIQLTDEQLKMLRIEIEGKRNNPFERVTKDEEYYCIKETGEIYTYYDNGGTFDNILYAESNYFNDKPFAKQIALHHLLYHKLLKFAYENECEDAEWDAAHMHWCIYYNMDNNKFDIDANATYKQQGVYFSTSHGAKRAIEEVIKPFIKEHPEFVW